MLVDRQTLQDLGVLHPYSEQSTIFDWANFTSTAGGERRLRTRFQEPLSNVDEIRATQEAVVWLGKNSDLFDPLLSRGAWLSMERYLTSSASPLDQLKRIVLWIDSYWIRYRHADVYREVLAAISLTQTLVRSAAVILTEIEASTVPAVVSSWATQLRKCVDAESVSRIINSPDMHRLRGSRVLDLHMRLREEEFAQIRTLAGLMYQIDALRSLALATRERALSIPEFLDGGDPLIVGEGLYHPLLEMPVGNSVSISPEERLVFLTGPNMAGKSTYLKALGLAVYLAHLGMGVPVGRLRLTPFDCLFSGINTTDNLRLGESYFFGEVRRVLKISEILAKGTRSLVIFDEMFKGTNLEDASDASLEVLSGFASCETSAFVIASHISELASGIGKLAGIQLAQFGADAHNRKLTFDYRLRPGVSDQRLGMLILEREGVIDTLRSLKKNNLDR